MNCPICGGKLPSNTYDMLYTHLTGPTHMFHYDHATLIAGMVRREGNRMHKLTQNRIDLERNRSK